MYWSQGMKQERASNKIGKKLGIKHSIRRIK